MSRTEKINQNLKDEVDFLNLTILSNLLDVYNSHRKFIFLKENIKPMPEPNNRVTYISSSPVSLGRAIEGKISPYGYYLDITEEQCNLLLQHWDALLKVKNIFNKDGNINKSEALKR